MSISKEKKNVAKKERARRSIDPVFKPTDHLPQSPTATVLFKGLVVIGVDEDGDKKTGLIGLHRLTDDHYLIIEIRGRRADGTSFLVARHVGPLSGRDMNIGIDPPTGNGVVAYQPGAKKFDRTAHTNDAKDFRWKVDMHDPDLFHKDTKLKMFRPGVAPCIYLKDGVFHTAVLTDEIDAESVPPSGGAPKPLVRLAAVIGAAIETNESQSILVDWGTGETPIVLPRSSVDPPDTTYVISVRNEPLAISLPSDKSDDELEHYYEVLRKHHGGSVVPKTERFRLAFHRMTDEIPCMPTVLGP
jgi:hypothetical protein